MSDNRRMTTDRFYGGVSDRLQNLRSMLAYVRDRNPTRKELNQWIIENTRAGSSDAVSHHLTSLDSIRLIELSDTHCELDRYGQQWLDDQAPETLYEALSSGVKGFATILEALRDGPMTDEDIMELLVGEFEEAEMTTPGPAARHREWLQVLGYIERDGEINRLTERGREMLDSTDSESLSEAAKVSKLRAELLQNEMACVPPGRQHIADDIYPAVESAYPSLCNDDYRCDEAHENGQDQPEWHHAVRDIQQRIAGQVWGRIQRLDDYGMWLYLPRFEEDETYERQKLHDQYGGRRYSGIVPSAQYPLVFLFTGSAGEEHGYRDEFRDDGTVIYTGEGQEGDMTYDGGNKAIGDHQDEERELHLFENAESGMARYIGQYECADWFREELPDTAGEKRSAIRFELQPIKNTARSVRDEHPETGTSTTEDSDTDGDIDLPDGQQTTERRETTAERVERDEAIVRELKRLYNDTCQVCGDRRLQGPEEGFSQVHHLMPLGEPHDGPDVPENVIVVCPNHHQDFENGMLTIDPQTLEINHEYEDEISGDSLQTQGDHDIGAQYLAYHNQVIIVE